MKRHLCELRDEELLKVYEVNKGLQQLIYEYEYESVNVYIQDLFYYLKSNNAIENYNIDNNSSNNFIVVKDTYEFFENVISMLINFQLDESNKIIMDEAKDGLQWCIAKDSVDFHSRVYDVLDDKVDATKDIVVSMVKTLLLGFLDLDEETLKTMFIEYVHNHEVFDNIYITSDNYIAYEELLKDYENGR
jgi:hypothetical protein